MKNFGLRKTTTDRWTSKTETDVFGFRFNWLGVRFPPNFSTCPCRSSAPSTLAHVSPTSQEPMKINTCVGVACHHRSSKWIGAGFDDQQCSLTIFAALASCRAASQGAQLALAPCACAICRAGRRGCHAQPRRLARHARPRRQACRSSALHTRCSHARPRRMSG